MVLPPGVRGQLKAFSNTTGYISSLSWLMRLVEFDWRSNELNSLTGQGFEPMNSNRVVRGSMDQVKFAGAMGRSNPV